MLILMTCHQVVEKSRSRHKNFRSFVRTIINEINGKVVLIQRTSSISVAALD